MLSEMALRKLMMRKLGWFSVLCSMV